MVAYMLCICSATLCAYAVDSGRAWATTRQCSATNCLPDSDTSWFQFISCQWWTGATRHHQCFAGT